MKNPRRKRGFFILCTLVGVTCSSFAAFAAEPQVNVPPPKEKTPFEQALEHNQQYTTKERWVHIGNGTYREVEYRGEKYYMRFLESGAAQLDCDLPNGTFNPNLAEVGTEVHRTKAFVSLLQESCAPSAHGQRQVRVDLNPRLGITLPDAPKDKLKKKTISVNPLTKGVNFSGEW